MLGMPGTLFGIAGTAFLAVSFAQNALSDSAPPKASLHEASMAQEVMSAAKADRLSKPVRVEDRSTVTTVELVGIGKATVILRDEAGKIVYRADPQSNTTYFAKDVDLPVVTIKEEAASPVAQRPVNLKTEPKVERENALEEPKRKSNPVGCLGALSPLVKSEASKTPSLCLASLESGRLS